MSKTYSILKQLIMGLTEAQVSMIQTFLHDMDDDEFGQIPIILFTPDQKKLLDTYGIVIPVFRKNKNPTSKEDEFKAHTIYCIFPSFFKVII